MTTLSRSGTEPPAWHVALHGLGLRLGGEAAGKRSGKVRFGLDNGWGRFEIARSRRGDALAKQLGRPGLWKLHGINAPSKRRDVFELPPAVFSRAGSDAACIQALARWALSTASGKLDKTWTPPPRDQIESGLPEMALTLQIGSIALQGRVTHDTGRLAFGFPIVQGIPADLPAARMAWLRELLTDAQDRWRLVRVGLTAEGEAVAEVDLSGAPHDAIETLVPIGVDALRLVVSSLAEPAEFLVRGAKTCRALEFPPTNNKRRPV